MSLNKPASGAAARLASGRGLSSAVDLPRPKRSSNEADTGASDSSQWTIEQNKQILLHLKQDNKEAKQDLSKRSTASAREARRSHADKTAEKLEKAVHGMRRQYDKIMQEKKTALSRLINLQDSMRDLSKASGGTTAAAAAARSVSSSSSSLRPASAADPALVAQLMSGPASRDVRQLENRLDKAALKANEAHSIQKTYDLVLERMRGEQGAAELHSRAVEEALRATAKEQERLIISSKEAQHARDLAKQDLLAYEEKLGAERQQRERQLEEQRGQAALMQQANSALLQRQYPPVAGDAAEGGAQDAAAAAAGRPVADAAGAVRALCRVAGCSSVEALLSALLPQQSSSRNLQEMHGLAQEQLDELVSELALERGHMNDLRGGGKLTTQSQLDSAQQELKEAVLAADEARGRHDQVLRSHADVCAGLEHLAAMVAALPAPPGQPPMAPAMTDPEQAVEAVAQCELRLSSAYKFICGMPKAAQLLQDMSSNPDFTFTAQ